MRPGGLGWWGEQRERTSPVNVLLVTFDQLRADMVGHPLVATPAFDRLAAQGVHFARHFSQAAPCAPGRAALYTGTYQMNNRVVANGTPLDRRFDNIAHLAARAGFDPSLFGYTDQGIDPRDAENPNDPRLDTFTGILPGFTPTFWLPDDPQPWLEWLSGLGYETGANGYEQLTTESDRPAEHSLSAFLTNHFLEWLTQQDESWFAHVSYWRPHPPYCAAGEFSRMYDPADVGDGISPGEQLHPLHLAALEIPGSAAPSSEVERRALRAQYFGMVSEVDAQFGRIIDALEESGMWDETIVIMTADHGEQLGDHGLIEKLGFFEESYRVPCIIHSPRNSDAYGSVIERFTENIDIFPTLAVLLDQEIPVQCDGMPLTQFLEGVEPITWRTAAHYEWDWRYLFLGDREPGWPLHRFLEHQNLAVLRDDAGAYVHFGDGSWIQFDLIADPTWRTTTTNSAEVLPYTQAMLSWRQEHLERSMTDMLLTPERTGRWPVEH